MIIYYAQNKLNGKRYIGKTTYSLELRISGHKKESCKPSPKCYFHRAIKKYGLENFEWNIIERCNNIQDLDQKEIYYINLFQTRNHQKGYNIHKGGKGFKPSAVTRTKLSLVHLGKKLTEQHKQKIRISVLKTMSQQEIREKISLGVKNMSKESRLRGAQTYKKNHALGLHKKPKERTIWKKHSDITIKKMEISQQKRFELERIQNDGNGRSKETRNKIREGLKNYYEQKCKLIAAA